MASPSPRHLISLFLFFQFLCFTTTLSLSSAVTLSSSASGKVSLALYYETLCPYCSKFIVNHLAKIFERGLIDIIDLNLVPYGNAIVVPPNDTITCQHGEFECLLNTVEACAINVWPDLNKHFTFIYCVERLVVEGKYKEWESCFGQMGLDPKPIADCFNSGKGKQLELKYAKETNDLQPPHTYVPWVVVDGKPIYENYEQFATYVCKAYKGTALPKACRELPLEITPKAKSNQMLQVSYADETSPTTKIRSPVTSWRRQMKMTASSE
ncbi:Gamma interferon inducible lysosomal thiol reductase GILT [Macleaya cordata]|uniref:Gamma interferon inducible lysosomal thiol reductase GILT n=1 Tax=Macleaya cordata TaxID=56857 RepID=A0A200PX48_MACCD|nr:Gamma interferon inducible lysosomal thiol reductase GILT [Macleaya cordata]